MLDYRSKKQLILPLMTFFLNCCFCFASDILAPTRARPGCPERPVWCSPAVPCSPGSGTGPGGCTCLSVYSHKCQSSVHSLAPTRGKKSTKKQTIRGLKECKYGYISVKHCGKGLDDRWETGRKGTPSKKHSPVIKTHWNTPLLILCYSVSIFQSAMVCVMQLQTMQNQERRNG